MGSVTLESSADGFTVNREIGGRQWQSGVVDQQAMIEQVTSWAAGDENIRAVVLTGSSARDDYDELSDLDLELYLRDPSNLLTRRDWYDQFGEVLAVEELANPGWMPTRLLYLVDGKIDFAIGDLASFGRMSRSVWNLGDGPEQLSYAATSLFEV